MMIIPSGDLREVVKSDWLLYLTGGLAGETSFPSVILPKVRGPVSYSLICNDIVSTKTSASNKKNFRKQATKL